MLSPAFPFKGVTVHQFSPLAVLARVAVQSLLVEKDNVFSPPLASKSKEALLIVISSLTGSSGFFSNSSSPQALNPAHTAINNEAANNLNIFIVKSNLRLPVPYGKP